MSVTAFKAKTASARSPERQELTLAISRLGAIAATATRYRLGLDRNREQWSDILDGKSKAEEALAKAQTDLADAFLSNALGTDGNDVVEPSLDQARANLAAAQDAYSANRQVAAALEAKVQEVEQDLAHAKLAVPRRIPDVLLADINVANLIAEYDLQERKLAVIQLALMEIARARGLKDAHDRVWPTLAATVPENEINGLALRWRAAIASLHTDPDAKMPGIE
jgi:hypothetical protein